MPSPIAHVAVGYAVFRWLAARVPSPVKSWPALFVFAVCVVLSLLPDADSVVGVLAGDLGRFHNNLTHSLAAGCVVALAVAVVARLTMRTGFLMWFILTLVCYWLHVAMDCFTVGRGVMLLWPFSDARFQAPVLPFRGVQWAMGPWSVEHVWTVLNELVFVGALAALMLLVGRLTRLSETPPGRSVGRR